MYIKYRPEGSIRPSSRRRQWAIQQDVINLDAHEGFERITLTAEGNDAFTKQRGTRVVKSSHEIRWVWPPLPLDASSLTPYPHLNTLTYPSHLNLYLCTPLQAMDQANLSIEEILKQVQASLAEQIRATVSQTEDRMKSEFEERLNNAAATAAAATLQHEQEIRAAISQAEENSKDRIEKLEAAVAEAQKDEDAEPRNLVVCIDGTANQFGVKVRTRPTTPTAAFQSYLSLLSEFQRRRALSPPREGQASDHLLQQWYRDVR